MGEWKASAVIYGTDVADTAARLEQRLNAMQADGYTVHSIFHSAPHFVVVAHRAGKGNSHGVSAVRQPARSRKVAQTT